MKLSDMSQQECEPLEQQCAKRQDNSDMNVLALPESSMSRNVEKGDVETGLDFLVVKSSDGSDIHQHEDYDMDDGVFGGGNNVGTKKVQQCFSFMSWAQSKSVFVNCSGGDDKKSKRAGKFIFLSFEGGE